jgi:hypothetical protein
LSSVVFAFPAFARGAPAASRADCAHAMPSGARIDAQTSIVTLNGRTVDVSACTPEPTFGTNGGYYAELSTPYNPGAGTLTDDFGGVFVVPNYPGGSFTSTENSSTGTQFWSFWTGLSAFGAGWPGGEALLQPILAWTNPTIGGGHAYQVLIEFVAGSGAPLYATPLAVTPGDEIESAIWQIASNPDAWEAAIEDLNSGEYIYAILDGIPSSWAKFTQAELVFEAWGNNSNTAPLPSCGDLPPTTGLSFDVVTFDVPSPAWNSYTPYTGSNLWTGTVLGKTGLPTTTPSTCAWSTAVDLPTLTLGFKD